MYVVRKGRYILALLLVLCTLSALLPLCASADGTGYFTLFVTTRQKTIIEPTRVKYTVGQTIADALAASEYDFKFNDSNRQSVESIEGESVTFLRFYYPGVDGNNYDLSVQADSISLLVFTETDGQDCDAVKNLVTLMGEYNDPENNVRNYTDAKSAYKNALQGLRTANASEAEALYNTLKAAMDAYDAILNGTKQTVTFSVTQNGSTVSSPEITMTDIYGNVATATGTSIDVVAGEYDFDVTSGYNSVRGKVTVESGKDASVTAALPYGSWFGKIKFSRSATNTKAGTKFSDGEYTLKERSGNSATFYVEDCTDQLYMYAEQGTNAPGAAEIRTVFETTNGKNAEDTDRSWESENVSVTFCLTNGMEGRDITLEARYTDSETGYTQVQSFAVKFVRVPTLKSLTVTAPDGTKQVISPAFDAFTTDYSVTSVFDFLTLSAEGYGDGYTITGTISGAGTATGNVTTSGDTKATITVSANGQSTEYTVTIAKESAAKVTIAPPDSYTAVQVLDSAGNEVNGSNNIYSLVPGGKYTYIATKNTYCHTTATFTASDGSAVSPPAPDTNDAITDAKLYKKKNSSSREEFEPDKEKEFAPSTHALTYTITDNMTNLYVQATPYSDYTVEALYTNTNSKQMNLTVATVDSSTDATALNTILAKGGVSGTLTLRASKEVSGVTYYQDYVMTLARKVRLGSLALSADGQELTLKDSDGSAISFASDTTEYYVDEVGSETEKLTLTAKFINESDDGYRAEIGGETYTSLYGVDIPLSVDNATEDITITVSHTDTKVVETEYTVHVTKQDSVKVTFTVTPANATVFLMNNSTGRYSYPDSDGAVMLQPGASYTYNVTCAGYVGVQKTAYTVPAGDDTITVTLTEAPARTYTAQEEVWPALRADEYNNGVVSAKTPTAADNAELYWATKVGEGYSSGACGSPILVGDYLYTYAGKKIYKLDTVTGKVVTSGQMSDASSYAINNPTYAEGMIFVGLSNGRVQAFDAETLKSLWIYTDSNMGQPNCPIVYHNGYIYTGFWAGEKQTASFVCISVTDEDPTKTNESKIATWQYASPGGFYWAGAYVTDKYVLVATDDGESGYYTGHAKLLSLAPLTGRLISEITLPQPGDARCSVVYSDGYAYFTTKGGYFYRARVSNDGELSDLQGIELDNGTDGSTAMSTSSPVIYNGRAYIGVAGTGQFSEYSGHNITVIDLENWNIAYSVQTQGYPQTSGLLTTAYDGGDGTVYVYFIENYTPGKVRVLRDKPGQTVPDITTTESCKGTDYTTAAVLFTPGGSQAQYAICSPITDKYGTMYFKNDSGYLMALGSKITALRVDKKPDKTVYRAGETFDAAGMKITAVYANGETRDVTDYVTYSTKALTETDTTILVSYQYVMYQDKNGSEGSQSPLTPPTVSIDIGIGVLGDVNGDGKITAQDAAMTGEYARNKNSTRLGTIGTTFKPALADVNGDGSVTIADAEQILAYSRGEIKSFTKSTTQAETEISTEGDAGS